MSDLINVDTGLPILPPKPVNSCFTCPSFVPQEQTPMVFDKSNNAARCRRFGLVLTLPRANEATNARVAEHIGTNCGKHGVAMTREELDAPIKHFGARVMKEDFTGIETRTDSETKPNACGSCMFHIPAREVRSETGWLGTLCKPRGFLINPDQAVKAAAACPIGRIGPTKYRADDIQLMEHFTEEFYQVDLYSTYGMDNDPLDHETDKPVTDKERQDGIKAWRRIPDPDDDQGKRCAYLPIYEPTFFTEEERAKIPRPGDDEHPELYLDHQNLVYVLAVAWMELDETPAVWGYAGLGKTELFRYMAFKMQIPFERFSITSSTELDDLAGHPVLKSEQVGTDDDGQPILRSYTEFKRGRFTKAWTKPGVLCVDEPNAGRPDVWQFFRPLTDNSKQMVLDSDEGERIERGISTFLGMAMNPAWDSRNSGIETLADADGSRLMHIQVHLPPPDLEMKIIQDRCDVDNFKLSRTDINGIMQVANDLRAMSDSGSLPITWGIRNQIKVARAFKWFSAERAYKLAIDHLEPDIQATIMSAVRTVFKKG